MASFYVRLVPEAEVEQPSVRLKYNNSLTEERVSLP